MFRNGEVLSVCRGDRSAILNFMNVYNFIHFIFLYMYDHSLHRPISL